MHKINLSSPGFLILGFLFLWACKTQSPGTHTGLDLPYLENYSLDGNPEEWDKIDGYRLWADALGRYADPGDFEAHMKAAWNKNNLLLLLEVNDNSFLGDTLKPFNGDAIEVFLASSRGSEDILHISVIPDPAKDFHMLRLSGSQESSKLPPGLLRSVSKTLGSKRITELEINLDSLPGGKAWINDTSRTMAMQVYADDADTGRIEKNLLIWYPVGLSYMLSSSMYTVKLAEKGEAAPRGSSRLVITDNDQLNLYVFGAGRGDSIGVCRNGGLKKYYMSGSFASWLPDTIDISHMGLDTEKDTLIVSLNDENIGFHELLISPRIYKNIEEPPFNSEIRNFVFKDRQAFPPENGTLFIGSSSIVRWKNLENDFPELNIIQRGFGGSISSEALMYMNQIVLPYKPATIIYYEGDNDVAKGISPEEIRDNVKAFIDSVRESLPHTKIYILSPKPSISRMYLWDKYLLTHALLKEMAEKSNGVKFVDVSSPMFDEKGSLNQSIFVEDGIHMNDAGYKIWIRILRKSLNLD